VNRKTFLTCRYRIARSSPGRWCKRQVDVGDHRAILTSVCACEEDDGGQGERGPAGAAPQASSGSGPGLPAAGGGGAGRGADGGRGLGPDRRRLRRAHAEPHDPAQRLSAAALGHAGGHGGAGDPEAARRQLLPDAARGAAPQRTGTAGRRAASLRRRRLHAAGRRPGEGARLRGYLEESGVTHLRRARRRGRELPRPSARTATSGSTRSPSRYARTDASRR